MSTWLFTITFNFLLTTYLVSINQVFASGGRALPGPVVLASRAVAIESATVVYM